MQTLAGGRDSLASFLSVARTLVRARTCKLLPQSLVLPPPGLASCSWREGSDRPTWQVRGTKYVCGCVAMVAELVAACVGREDDLLLGTRVWLVGWLQGGLTSAHGGK
jgi:hypothetical protein